MIIRPYTGTGQILSILFIDVNNSPAHGEPVEPPPGRGAFGKARAEPPPRATPSVLYSKQPRRRPRRPQGAFPMTTGQIDKTLEQQIAAIVQRTLDDHYQGTLTFGPIRVEETDDMVTGEWYLQIYIVVDGDYGLLTDVHGWKLFPLIKADLSDIGVNQFVSPSFIPKGEWTWFSKARGFDS